MECPKCGIEIDDKTIVCPNCKKVLKLVCPVCKTVNDTNTCKKCGYVIITKCHKCGKINQTAVKKCKKCGFSTEHSVILNEANSDEFVFMKIEFPNLSDMKGLLGTAKLFNKFKINLDKIIYDYVKSVGLRRQIVENVYIIRCDKDYTFKTSAESAMTTAVALLNKITEMNCKLTTKKNALVRCNISLFKRGVNDNPYDFDSGFNIKLINQSTKSKEAKVLDTFQVIADQSVYDCIQNDYKAYPLNSVVVNNQMSMFYEVDLRELVKVEYPAEDDGDEIKIPNFVQNMLLEQDQVDGGVINNIDLSTDSDRIYDLKTIDFEEINADFIRTENIDVFYHIVNKLQSFPKGIIALKTLNLHKPYSLKLINTIEGLNIYNNIITITCYDEMKYSPYSFFRDLLSAIFEYTVSQKLFSQNDFTMFASVDPDGLVKDLIMLKARDESTAEDTRYVYFDIFLTLLQAIPNTLIYIEDFEKIDSSSYDVLKYLFEAFEKLDISYLISYDKKFSLHKQSHFLLSKPYYTEITLKPTPFEKMIEENKYYFRNILDNFYFHRIAKYSCGSILFLDIAIQYLIESGVFEAREDSLEMIDSKTIIIPSSLEKLMKRRLNLLKDDMVALRFLTSLVLLGTRVDIPTIESLEYDNINEIIDKLSRMGYVYFYNNCLYFPNYNILKDALLDVVAPVTLKEIARELLDKVMVYDMPSPVKADLYKLLNDKDSERREWELLAQINLSLGDFSSYLNCTSKILNLLDEFANGDNSQELEEYKFQLYENISNNLYEYIPDKTSAIAEETLKNLEKSEDINKTILLCNKMIQGNLIAGNYVYALELTHKVLSLIPPASLNPDAPDFNSYFFLMSLIHIHILFNIGALCDCMEVGYKVLNVVSESTLEKLKPDYIDMQSFRTMLIDSVGYVALANVLMLGGNVGEFLNIVRRDLNDVPDSYDIFIELENMLHGRPVSRDISNIAQNDKFGTVISHLMNAFLQFSGNYVEFAEEVYKAKIVAKINSLHQLELFADLLIGYAYMNIDSVEKADDIIYKVIQSANEKGMNTLLYSAWYIMSELKLKLNQYDLAYGILNNSIIQLEKTNITTEYLTMLFKYNMYKVLMYQKNPEQAGICIEQAKYLAGKYGIIFEFDTNPDRYIPIEENIEQSSDNNDFNSDSDMASIDDLG